MAQYESKKDQAKKDPQKDLMEMIDKELTGTNDPRVRDFAKKLKERVSKMRPV